MTLGGARDELHRKGRFHGFFNFSDEPFVDTTENSALKLVILQSCSYIFVWVFNKSLLNLATSLLDA